MSNNVFDVIIIGGGPAGLTAGLYTSRARLNTMLLEKMGAGGQAAVADWIENYPGFPEGISGLDLTQKIEDQAKKFGLTITLEEAASILPPENDNNLFTIKTHSGEYKTLSIIIASGTEHKLLNVPGELELRGRGISYCATCDAPFFKEKAVIVAGGGNSAVQEALYLTRFASKVTIVHRRASLRATRILQERAFANKKINFAWNSVINAINGKDNVESVTIKNLDSGKIVDIPAGGVFIFVGLSPNSKAFKGLIELDSSGYVISNDNMASSVPGIFVCGDVRKKHLRQIVTAAGDGAAAAFSAQEYIENLKK